MNTLKFVGAGMLALVTGVCAQAAEVRDGGLRGDLRRMCDPVCELRAQDGAFSLLVEAYREFQSFQIETDYQTRVRLATSMSEERGSLVIASSSRGAQTLRQFVIRLAKQERDLRFEKLQTEVVNFHSAYSCARKVDEDYVGQKIPSTVNERAAAATLKDYCLVTPGSLAQSKIQSAPCEPASNVLLDIPPVTPKRSEVVESCD